MGRQGILYSAWRQTNNQTHAWTCLDRQGADSFLAKGEQDKKEQVRMCEMLNLVFSQEKYARVQRKISMHKNYAKVWSDKNKQRQA